MKENSSTIEDPKVSILIPCYNAEKWIGLAIESALAQEYENKEVIVVDDGSTDKSFDVIKSYGDAIRYEGGQNRGGNVTRNRLLEMSTGEWLQYLDADDYLKSKKVSDQLTLVRKASDVDLIYGPSIMAYHEGELVREAPKPIPEPHDPWILLATWLLPQTGSPLWRKQAVLDAGGWKEDQPCCQEHELYTRMLMNDATFKYADASGSVYRQWSEETVCKKDVSKVHHFQTIIRHEAEAYLKQNKVLTPQRQRAFSQGHFETARMMWLYDKTKAEELMAETLQRDPTFIPTGSAAPSSYRFFFKWLGFPRAESIAAWKRKRL